MRRGLRLLARALAWAGIALLLAACGDYRGAGQDSVPIDGTWSGTRTQGAQSFPVAAQPFSHTTTGSLTLTFVDNGDGTFSGSIHIDPDICWTAFAGHVVGQQPQDAALTVTVDNTRVAFEYTSPLPGLSGGLVRFAAPVPFRVPWVGSYDGSACGSGEPGENTWIGDFSVSR